MIQNLKTLHDMPVARTNLIRLQDPPLETIRRLLSPVSNLYVIDFGLRRFNKERKESGRAYNARIHREVKIHLRKKLGLDDKQDVKYELLRLQNGQHVLFYLNQAAAPGAADQHELIDRVETLCVQLTAEHHSLNRLVQGLFGLHLKMVMLEQAADRFSVEPVYFNAKIYLNARQTRSVQRKSNSGVMEAFELYVFASEQNELAFTLHKRKFLITPAEELNVKLDDEKVWFNTAAGRLIAKRALDARDSKLVFFKERSGYGECQAYTYNVVMNTVHERLEALDIPFETITFQACHEVDNFSTDLDSRLDNRLFVVNAGVPFTHAQEQRFFAHLREQLPIYTLLGEADLIAARAARYADWDSNTSVLVLNPVTEGARNSIRKLNAKADEEFGDFFAAYEDHIKDPLQAWDLYTELKFERLKGWLDEEPLPVVLQGMNIDGKLLAALDYIAELEQNDPARYDVDLSKAKSRLKTCLNSVVSKIKRIKTELWFKESLLSLQNLAPLEVGFGHYTAYFVRATDNGNTYLGYVELVADDDGLKVESSGVIEGDLEWLATEHPPLERLSKLYNNSFYLYDHMGDALLTTYSSIRVPRLIGPAGFDAVEWYSHQESEKVQAERQNEKFTDFAITRSAKPQQNVLPYYLAPGRAKSDPLVKSAKLKHHHIYLQPHEGGLYVLMSSAQPVNPTIARQNLVENLLIWNAQGQPLNVIEHPLTGVYLNSFTLDMLKNGESSKTSFFAKLAKLMVEN